MRRRRHFFKKWLDPLPHKSNQTYEREDCIHLLTKILLSAYHEPGIGKVAKNKVENATICMNLEDIRLSEIRQSQKDKYCVIPLIGGP